MKWDTLSKKSWITYAILIAVALLSMFLLSNIFSSPKLHAGTIGIIDDLKMDVTMFNVVITASSTALTALPDDTGSSVADELDDLSFMMFMIMCILYAEKFLLTTFIWITFSFFVPGACVLGILFKRTKNKFYLKWIIKLVVLAIAFTAFIPLSVRITQNIEETHAESVDQAIDAVNDISKDTDSSNEEKKNAVVQFFNDLKDNVVNLLEAAKNMLSVLIDAVAVMMITRCIIPLLTAIAFIYVVRFIIKWDMAGDKEKFNKMLRG